MDIRKMSALEIGSKIRNKEISSPEVTEIFLNAIQKDETNAFININKDSALKEAEEVQKKIDKGAISSPLMGVPVAVKDNYCIEGEVTTSASRMLENFRPPYSATVIEKIKDAGAVVLGKTNMDEFAMGGSTESSYFGVTKNPWNLSRVPGGSSGGSAAAVAAELAPYALGSDTGGSIRQPCSHNNLTGIKPTYGSVSRYGIMAYGSSLDQAGTMGRNAKDCAASLSIISGHDEKDSTSILDKPFDVSSIIENKNSQNRFKGMKVGLPINFFGEGLAEDVSKEILRAADELKAMGAEVEEFRLPIIDYAVPTFYLISCAEASSNLSRFDGVMFGYKSPNAKNISEIYYKSRSEGFGTEVKRRIMLGSFVLSSGYFDAYYKKALQVRGLIKTAFDEALSKYDFILSPIAPTVAYKLGAMDNDPLAMYMADIYTVCINLAGLPSVALPCGSGEGGMPVGMQFVGKAFDEVKLLSLADSYQQQTEYHKRRPDIVGGSNTTITKAKKRGEQ